MQRIAMVVVNIGLLIFSLHTMVLSDDTVPYGIIIGDNVNMREKPTPTAKIVYRFTKKDIVFFVERSEKEEEMNNEKYYWYRVKTQKKTIGSKVGWVYGKYFKLLDDNASEEDKILKKLIDKEFYDQLFCGPTYYYNPQLKIIQLNKKKYYLLICQARDDTEYLDYGWRLIYTYDKKIKDYIYERGHGIDSNEYFYDLDDDGYAEIFLYDEEYRYIIVMYSEKLKKDIFKYSLPFMPFYQGKRINNSWVELKEIEPGKKCEIVVHLQEDKNGPMREIIYRWNGETFVADKK